MLLRYHPERYSLTRPFSKQVVNYFRNYSLDGLPTIELVEILNRIFIKNYNEMLLSMPLELRPKDTGLMQIEMTYAVHYADFVTNGRNVFHFEPEMVEKFKQTDIDEVPASVLQFPFPVFYMSFGLQEDMDLWGNGYFVDGAYVIVHPNFPLQIVLSTIRKDIEYKNNLNWIINPDRYYYLPLEIKDSERSISEIVDKALGKELKEHDLSNLPDDSGIYQVGDRKVMVTDNKFKSSEQTLNDISKGFPVFREALRLVINGLCYITSYRDDIESKWPEEAPKLLVERLENAPKASSKKKIRSELLSQGYTKINYCGTSFKKNYITVIPSGKEKTTHWRRGHWRNQPHGPQHSQRKLIWIMPVLVGKAEVSEQGHIYNIHD